MLSAEKHFDQEWKVLEAEGYQTTLSADYCEGKKDNDHEEEKETEGNKHCSRTRRMMVTMIAMIMRRRREAEGVG